MVGVLPGTVERPTITVTDEDVRVLVRGETIAKLVQLDKTKRWVIAIKGAKHQPQESWRFREQAIEGVRAYYRHGVPK